MNVTAPIGAALLGVFAASTSYVVSENVSDIVIGKPRAIVIRDMRLDGGAVVYDRLVAHSGFARWEAAIIDAATGGTICEGSGRSLYDSREPTTQIWTPAQFVGAPCDLSGYEAVELVVSLTPSDLRWDGETAHAGPFVLK